MKEGIQEMHKNIQAALQELDATRARECKEIVQNAQGLMTLRIIETGRNAEGAPFSRYSEALVPYWFFGSNLGGKADFDVKKKQKELLAEDGYFSSYKRWREINHRRTDIKNFSFTQTLFRSLLPVEVSRSQRRIVFQIRSSDNEYQEVIIPAQSNREGIFIFALSAIERASMKRSHELRIERILKKNNVFK